MNIIKTILLFFYLVFLIGGCGVSTQNDIYNKIPKGTLLNMEILKKSRQIIPNRDELILNYDISEYWDKQHLHLLFFNNKLELYSACYLPSLRIESLNNNVITAISHQEKQNRANKFKNDLPQNYQLKLISQSVTGWSRVDNKVIKNIEISPNQQKVRLLVAISEDIFAGLEKKDDYLENQTFLDQFKLSDTLFFSFDELNFDYNQGVIFTTYIDAKKNRLIHDNMIVLNSSIFDKFYDDLIQLY